MNYEEDYRKCSKIAREASRYARLQMKNWELGSGEADCLAQIRKHPGCSPVSPKRHKRKQDKSYWADPHPRIYEGIYRKGRLVVPSQVFLIIFCPSS